MNTFVFSSKEELLEQAKKDGACKGGLLWANEQESLESILEEIPIDYRIWCLKRGYSQFIDDCSWGQLDGEDWRCLLIKQPQFYSFCSYWEKLDGLNWSLLLQKQPQFSSFCFWDKLDGNDWRCLVIEQPQFSELCNWEKLDGYNWRCLLIEQPQFYSLCNWEKLDDRNWRNLLIEQPQFVKFRK